MTLLGITKYSQICQSYLQLLISLCRTVRCFGVCLWIIAENNLANVAQQTFIELFGEYNRFKIYVLCQHYTLDSGQQMLNKGEITYYIFSVHRPLWAHYVAYLAWHLCFSLHGLVFEHQVTN